MVTKHRNSPKKKVTTKIHEKSPFTLTMLYQFYQEDFCHVEIRGFSRAWQIAEALNKMVMPSGTQVQLEIGGMTGMGMGMMGISMEYSGI